MTQVTVSAHELASLRALREEVQSFQFQVKSAQRVVKAQGGSGTVELPLHRLMDALLAISTAEDGMSFPFPSAHPWFDHTPVMRGRIVTMLREMAQAIERVPSSANEKELRSALEGAAQWLMLAGVVSPRCTCQNCQPPSKEGHTS
jgi:hypothetical protein